MKEYLATFDLPYVEFITYRVLGDTYEEAYNKFVDKLIQSDSHNSLYIDDEHIKVLPLWDIELI